MRSFSRFPVLTVLSLLPILGAGLGCSSDDVLDLVDVPLASVDGTWQYQVENPDQARYVNCTGDAVVLEGKTFTEGLVVAPICHVSGSFEVTQALAAMVTVPHQVTCSDGSTATITGPGIVGENTVSGQWDSVSDADVNGTQTFEGMVTGSSIRISEDRQSFGGSFQGACDISPPLSSTVLVQ